MTGESLQKIKLLRIVEMLKQESSEQRPLCTNEIVEKAAEMGVSVDRRMLSKEVEFLNAQGFDIRSRIVGHQNVSELEKALTKKKRASFYYFDRNEDGEKVYRLRGVLTVWKFRRLNLQNSVSIAKELKTGGAVWI